MPGPITKEHVREALLALYSPAELERTELAAALHPARGPQRGHALRRLLLDAIEALRPTGKVAPSASEYRAHECISLRYISSLSIEEIAEELALSTRQVYRDLRWGEERLCELLARKLSDRDIDQRQDSLDSELGALAGTPERVDLSRLISQATATVAPLADACGIRLHRREPDQEMVTSASPGILGEIITQLLSAIVQSTDRAEVEVVLEAQGDDILLSLPVGPEEDMARRDLLHSALRVAEAQNLRHRYVGEGDERCLHLILPRCGDRRVVVVEDNPAAFALYQRYLANSEWQPILAPSPRVAGNLAAATRAEAVLLDIMMPETDGWRVLQALKVDERTRDIPVIVCSVVDDPALGSALGAAAYITKPVSRPVLLQALNQVIRGRRQA
ncbi:MAG: response regulator [Anaerolineae bacterium]|nr:response regulator [Anaerolineae bacterium]